MGAAEPIGSKIKDEAGAGIHQKQIFASNTGKCMEESHPGISLSLGAGKIRWDNWIGVDSNGLSDVTADLKSLPFADDFADRIAAIHVIEHFYEWEAPEVLAEWMRVLKPGGELILELPCMDKVFYHIQQAMSGDLFLSPTYCIFPLWGDPKYKDVAMCHKWGYTVGMMKKLLEKVGFKDIKVTKPLYHFPDRDMRVTARK
jgi:predicted SAM-dependent methyltransferase